MLAAAEPVAGPDDVAMIEMWRRSPDGQSTHSATPTALPVRLPLPLRAKGPDIRMPNLRYHDQGVAAMEFLPALADGTPLLVSAGVATEGERACRRLHCACTQLHLQHQH